MKRNWKKLAALGLGFMPVSYTHLDVYKRQGLKGREKLAKYDVESVICYEGKQNCFFAVGQQDCKAVDFSIKTVRRMTEEQAKEVREDDRSVKKMEDFTSPDAVSYTHLDVYKRQG